METDTLVQPSMPERFHLPPLLNAMYENLARQPHSEENPLYGELQRVGRQLGQMTMFKAYSFEGLDQPVKIRDAQRMLLASTGPSGDGRCVPCGRDLSAK